MFPGDANTAWRIALAGAAVSEPCPHLLRSQHRRLWASSALLFQRRHLPGRFFRKPPRPFPFPSPTVVALGGVHWAGHAGNNNSPVPAEGAPSLSRSAATIC
jgi:hypothetical protein